MDRRLGGPQNGLDGVSLRLYDIIHRPGQDLEVKGDYERTENEKRSCTCKISGSNFKGDYKMNK
jgi:hypothetical protein